MVLELAKWIRIRVSASILRKERKMMRGKREKEGTFWVVLHLTHYYDSLSLSLSLSLFFLLPS